MEPDNNYLPAPIMDAPEVTVETMAEPKPEQPEPPATTNPESSAADQEDHAGPSPPTLEATETNNKGQLLDAWDFSDRRIHVQGVDKYANRKDLLKLAQKWVRDGMPGDNMEILKIKKPPNETWMLIHMAEPADAKRLLDYINDNQLQNKKGTRTLTARLLMDMHVGKRPLPDDNMDESKLTKRQKRNAEQTENGQGTSQQQQQQHRPVSEEEIKDKIIPLWRLSLEEQLHTKTKLMINQCALKIHKELKKRLRDMQKHKHHQNKQDSKLPQYDWLQGKQPITIDPVVSVPNVVRNKCEFTFGWRYSYANEVEEETSASSNGADAAAAAGPTGDAVVSETQDRPADESQSISTTEPAVTVTAERPIQRVPAVGMVAAGWAGGVSRPHCCENIPTEACAIVDLVDAFLLDSPLPPYDSKIHKGIWRLLTVRSSRTTRECMIVITHCPITGGVGEDGHEYAAHFESEKARLLSILTSVKLPVPDQEPISVSSIFFQEFEGLSSPTPETPVQHAHGKTHMLEQLLNCTFEISPGAFFQVNSVGAEMLYSKVIEKVKEVTRSSSSSDAAAATKTLLFDVCCGTGTIGQCCMKEGAVDRVIGVDISEPAIRNAQANAERNGFSSDNVRFVAGRAEDVLSQEIAQARRDGELQDYQFVAVVDPAREGLHPDVVRALRMTKSISRIVYVSCNPTGSLVNDLGLFCAPPSKRYTGRPFKISAATPFDMFPMTNHCEMVMVLDRLTEEECEGGETKSTESSDAGNDKPAANENASGS